MARLVFISPHLDDAVLSCGGLISKLSPKYHIEVWTLFCGRPLWPRKSPLVRWLHGICNARNASELLRRRRLEDKHALNIVGASGKYLSFLDSVYRLETISKPLYHASCVGNVHAKDSRLVSAISAALKKRLHAQDVVFCPLGIGNHVDHIITRQAVDAVDEIKISYYQDVPYVMSETNAGNVLPSFKELQVSLGPDNLSSWYNASVAYDSQMQMLFPQKSALEDYIFQFTNRPYTFFANNFSLENINSLFRS